MLDQFDLFEDTPKTSVVTPQPKAVTPVDNVDKLPKRPIFCPAKVGSPTVLNTTLEVNDKLDIFSFALQEARRIWPKGDQHRRRSLAQLEKFADFADNRTRALRDYRSSHVHRSSITLRTSVHPTRRSIATPPQCRACSVMRTKPGHRLHPHGRL